MILSIALGKSRRQKKWLNKKMSWEELVQKLSTTTRTYETYAQYESFDRERQSEIKDVGGFVGGFLTNGLRTPVSNIEHRQLITLDIDFGHAQVWEDFTMVYGFEALVYSTHKHSPQSPRLRLVVPIDRPVSREEYEAIARRLAEALGMSMFDSTTFQPQRLMYWPSTSSDGEYYFRYQSCGEYLCADEFLASYHNWKDISEWPMCETESATVRAEVKKLGDPCEKPGLVGAFCRAFGISDVREEFLSGIYEEAGENRMTFTGGSTFGGVVIYNNDTFSYSFHSTDPASGKLLNAFDLVRIHRFGNLDSDPSLTMQKLPSYAAMCELASRLPEVISEIGVFDEPIPEPIVDGENWMLNLTVNFHGKYHPTIENIRCIIENDEQLKDKIRYNRFENNIFLMSPVPWDKEISVPRPVIDADDAGLRHYLERVYGLFHIGKTFDAVNIVAQYNSYHPICDYISSLTWDGEYRLETMLTDYLGAEDTPYVRTVTRKAFAAAVARVFVPGIKFDYVLTLVGAQGIRKSTFFDRLGGKWFSDSFTTVQGKEAYEQLQGAWLIEVAELSGFKKSELEGVKHFISKRKDRFRVAYGRRNEDFPRQCAFFGTTNESFFLKDYTGNRRFWPVPVTGKVIGQTLNIDTMPVDQIWAEAKHYFDKGEKLWLDNLGIETDARLMQSDHSEIDERCGIVERYLNTLLPENWDKFSIPYRRSWLSVEEDIAEHGKYKRETVCVAEIWCEVFRKDVAEMNSSNTKYIHQILSSIKGWEKVDGLRLYGPYGRQRGYSRTKVAEPVVEILEEI